MWQNYIQLKKCRIPDFLITADCIKYLILVGRSLPTMLTWLQNLVRGNLTSTWLLDRHISKQRAKLSYLTCLEWEAVMNQSMEGDFFHIKLWLKETEKGEKPLVDTESGPIRLHRPLWSTFGENEKCWKRKEAKQRPWKRDLKPCL